MTLEWFKCPPNDTISVIPVKACLEQCWREERCLTKPTLILIAQEREWSGVASTTQLLNGTMYSFLKLTQPYVVDPDGMAFALLGTKHHQQLDEIAKQLNLPSEIALTTEDRDIFDLLEPEPDGTWTLTDYKTWGSYRVASALGLKKVGTRPDPTGKTYKTNSRYGSKGSPIMVPTFATLEGQGDTFDVELQLNNYRLKLEERGIKIGKMRVQITVRDGGIQIAQSRGIERNTYMIPIPFLDDDYVDHYFTEKQADLDTALLLGKWDEPCDNRECWDGVRCERFCEVAMYCVKGVLHQK